MLDPQHKVWMWTNLTFNYKGISLQTVSGSQPHIPNGHHKTWMSWSDVGKVRSVFFSLGEMYGLLHLRTFGHPSCFPAIEGTRWALTFVQSQSERRSSMAFRGMLGCGTVNQHCDEWLYLEGYTCSFRRVFKAGRILTACNTLCMMDGKSSVAFEARDKGFDRSGKSCIQTDYLGVYVRAGSTWVSLHVRFPCHANHTQLSWQSKLQHANDRFCKRATMGLELDSELRIYITHEHKLYVKCLMSTTLCHW
jgi:hypothetical protein